MEDLTWVYESPNDEICAIRIVKTLGKNCIVSW